MPTTDPALLAVLLDAVRESGIRFAVLHNESRLAAGAVASDADIVTGQSPQEVLRAVAAAVRGRGVHAIALWAYDVGAASLFFATADGLKGAQLDVLHDPQGRGRYGLRGGVLLTAARAGTRWPQLDPLDEALYLVRKRTEKQQPERLAEARSRLGVVERVAVDRRIVELFSPRAAAAVRQATDSQATDSQATDRQDPTPARRLALRHPGRVLDRLRRPAGFWVALPPQADEAAARVVESLGAVLVHRSIVGDRVTYARWCRAVLPIRLRAGIVVSTARCAPGLRPDLVIPAHQVGEHDELLRRTVRAMEARLAASL